MKVIQRLYELQGLEMGPKAELPETRHLAKAIRKEIPEQVLAHYDRLRARDKKGVALVRHGVCTGCQLKLASGVYAHLLRDEDIAMCDSCARYLLLASDEAAPAASLPAGDTSKPPPPKPGPKARRRKGPAGSQS
jgi:hypothetical protein